MDCDVSAEASFFFFLPRFFGAGLSVVSLLADFVSVVFVLVDLFSISAEAHSFLLLK